MLRNGMADNQKNGVSGSDLEDFGPPGLTFKGYRTIFLVPRPPKTQSFKLIPAKFNFADPDEGCVLGFSILNVPCECFLNDRFSSFFLSCLLRSRGQHACSCMCLCMLCMCVCVLLYVLIYCVLMCAFACVDSFCMC